MELRVETTVNARRFYLCRIEDESGVSGTGTVAMGIEFPTKKIVMEWLVHPFAMSIHNSMQSVEEVHGHGGKTKVIWIDE